MRDLRKRFRGPGDFRTSVLMPSHSDDRGTWIRHSFQLALVTAGFHFLQFLAAGLLWTLTNSAALATFSLDAVVSAFAAMVLAMRIHRSFDTLGDNWRSRPAPLSESA